MFLFVCMIFTPEVVSDELFFFGEEDLESLIIFVLGLVGLLLYLGKESALIRTVTEKLSLQQESNKIRKDLAQTYTYIGEMNRQLEILKNVIVESPHTTKELLSPERERIFQPVFEAALLLSQSDEAELVFIDTRTRNITGVYYSDQSKKESSLLGADVLLDKKKYWWQEDGLAVVRSQEEPTHIAAFLIVRSTKNKIEEVGVFQILVTHALLLFSLCQVSDRQSFDW